MEATAERGAVARLTRETGRALRSARRARPSSGPPARSSPGSFKRTVCAGVLEYWSAVSVHPYRHADPETVANDYARMRRLIGRYAPSGSSVAVLSGEWGYSSAWSGLDESYSRQATAARVSDYLANGVPLSIWYDWHETAAIPRNPEHHFGEVR